MSDNAGDDVTKLIDNAKAPGTFNILNVLKERAYPKDDIHVYLDEDSAYKASVINEKIEELSTSEDPESQVEIEKLIDERDALIKKIADSKYVFTMVGISEGTRDDLVNKAKEKFPIEYKHETNVLTTETSKEEIESPERDEYFTELLWEAHIEKITAPDGSVQDNIAFEDIHGLRRSLPIAAISNISTSMEKLRLATTVFMLTVDEDFLAKS